jgi:hypothetical protein
VSRAGTGDYSNPSNERRAERRLAERLERGGEPVERVAGNEVARLPGDPEWTVLARSFYELAHEDEYLQHRGGTGDNLLAYLTADYLSRLFTADGKRPPADGVRVALDMIRELGLTDAAKRRAGLAVQRGEVEVERDRLDDVLDGLDFSELEGPDDDA